MIETYECFHIDSQKILFPATPFSVLMLCDRDSRTEYMAGLCDTLIKSGCLFFMSIGAHHEKWHMAFDMAVVHASPCENEEHALATISASELNYESFEEWLLLSSHPTAAINHGIILYESVSQTSDIAHFFYQIREECIL